MSMPLPNQTSNTLPDYSDVVIDNAEINRKISKAKSLLILDHPFFGAVVSKRPLQFSESIPTACMSATGQMTLNRQFLMVLNVQEIIFLLAHEAMHYMLNHSLRRGHRDPKQWNIAADKVINDTLIHCNVGKFIDGGVTFDGARDLSAEKLYNDTPDDGTGQGDDDGLGGAGMDIGDPNDGDGTQMTESQISEIEAMTKIELRQAHKAAKAAGKMPAMLDNLIAEILKVRTPWYEILERFINGKRKGGRSWKRPNRRFIHKGLYLKGKDNVPALDHIVLAYDTSMSIGPKEHSAYVGHVNRILETCTPAKVTVIFCDARVQRVEEHKGADLPLQLDIPRGGGTAFKPVFDYVTDNIPFHSIDALIYFTDGYGDQTSFELPQGLDVVWLTTDYEKFPQGKVVKFDLDEE